MIETKIFTKAKKGNGGASSSSTGTRYISGTISEAEHAARADKARKADSATQADYATNSGNAKVSDYARKAAEVDGDAEVLQNYLRKDYMEEADGSDHVEEVDNNVLFDRDVEFLNGFTADEASTFLGAADFRGKNTFYGLAYFLKTIYSTTIENSGTLKTKNLEVTGSAHFFELIIDKVKSAGGAALFTAADGFDVDMVAIVQGSYRLFWRCRDGNGKQRDNMWRKGDQALCMSFNQASVGTSHNVANKYYWALVTGVSDNSSPYLLKDEYYNYIDISRTDCDGTVNPEVGDSIVMLGYRGNDDADRQSAIYISAYTSLDSGLIAPLFAQYRGINDFDLGKHRTTYHDARGSKVVGQFELESGESVEDYIDNAVDGASDILEGQLTATARSLTSQYQELSGKYANLPLKSQEELTAYSSRIEQTARKISLSVGATVLGRRNLLVGSEFKRFDDENMTGQGRRDACRLRTGDQYDGYNSCRIVSESENQYFNGVVFKKIRVDGNTQYTLTTMAKRFSDGLGSGCYAIIHEYLTKDATLSGYQKSFYLLTMDDAKGTWMQKSYTFTTHSDTRYINVIFCVSTSGSFAICKPMLERGESFSSYSLSEFDYEYVGGNLIDNSRFLKAGGNLLYVQDSVSQELGSDYAIATATTSSSSSSKGVFCIKKTLKAGVDYVLSWYIKRTGGDENGQCTVNFGRKILYSERWDGTQAVNSVEGGHSPYSGYQGISNVPTEWARMWVHFRLSEDWTDDDNLIYIQLYGGSSSLGYITAQFSRPKLEEGAYPTEWTDKSVTMVDEGKLASQLIATGVDIVNKQVTVTADNFKVRNNNGVETLMVTKDGMLNASLIQADRLLCKAANGVTVSIHDGLIYFGGENGITNIKLGTDDDGVAILEFYDKNGVKRYDLGPNGLTNTEMSNAVVVSKTFYNLVSIFGVSMDTACGSVTHTSGGSSHTVTQTFYETREAYERKLFGYPVGTGKNVSLPTATELYQYQAGWIKNGSLKTAKADSARGLTSAMAAKADGLYFTSKDTMGDGVSELKNLAVGTFIPSLNIRENNFRQAILLDTYDYIDVPAYYIITNGFLGGVISRRWLYCHQTTRQYGSGWGIDNGALPIDEI